MLVVEVWRWEEKQNWVFYLKCRIRLCFALLCFALLCFALLLFVSSAWMWNVFLHVYTSRYVRPHLFPLQLLIICDQLAIDLSVW